jgi:hypothetical protein
MFSPYDLSIRSYSASICRVSAQCSLSIDTLTVLRGVEDWSGECCRYVVISILLMHCLPELQIFFSVLSYLTDLSMQIFLYCYLQQDFLSYNGQKIKDFSAPILSSAETCSMVKIWDYTGCNRRNGPDFGRVFLRLKYTDITQNTYIQSWTVTEIMAREKCGLLAGLRTVPVSW